jgi:cytochrome c
LLFHRFDGGKRKLALQSAGVAGRIDAKRPRAAGIAMAASVLSCPLDKEKVMKQSLLIALIAGGLVSNLAFANADLAKSKNCMACHSVDNKVVGPAFKDVAAKYAGQKGADDKLAEKIMKGSSGVWGQIPMPPNTNVSQQEAHTLAKWVLSLK